LLDLLDRYDARAYRMLLLQTHYRSPVKVGQDNIDASVKALAGLDAFAARSTALRGAPDEAVLARFVEVMDNDLDTPNAMAHVFDTVRRANSAIDSGDASAAGLVAAVHEMCGALGLPLGQAAPADDDAQAKAAALDAARAAKDFATADALRVELQDAGWIVETTKAGTTLRRA
jgi:cysteinyl-tRNA synthetase